MKSSASHVFHAKCLHAGNAGLTGQSNVISFFCPACNWHVCLSNISKNMPVRLLELLNYRHVQRGLGVLSPGPFSSMRESALSYFIVNVCARECVSVWAQLSDE